MYTDFILFIVLKMGTLKGISVCLAVAVVVRSQCIVLYQLPAFIILYSHYIYIFIIFSVLSRSE